jgi:hypothetical protein
MGQQQLLLITVGVIAVGIAVIIGISLFEAAATETNRDELVSALNSLGNMAQEYYLTPTTFGGGNRKFKGWKMPKAYKQYEGGKFKVKFDKKKDELTITATGKEKGRNNKNKVTVEANVKPKVVKIKVLN